MAHSKEKIEIGKTELRALIFWATNGISKSWGGGYMIALDYIKNNIDVMPKHMHSRLKKLEFGEALKLNK